MKSLKWSALKIPKGRPNKSITAYLERVYKQNQEVIDNAARSAGVGLWGTHIDGYEFLKTEVIGLLNINKGMKVNEAIRTVGRTEMFLTRTEKNLMNAQAGIIRNPELYKALRIAWGWNRPLDWNQLRVTESPNTYMFGDEIEIDFSNSPLEILLIVNGETQSFERF